MRRRALPCKCFCCGSEMARLSSWGPNLPTERVKQTGFSFSLRSSPANPRQFQCYSGCRISTRIPEGALCER